jgi:hypothetical protein
MTTLSQYRKRFRFGITIGGVVFCGFLAACGKTEEAPPPTEEPPSLMEQYKGASKESAENPGVAGSPGQMKEEKPSE